MPGCLIAAPSANVAPSATPTWPVGGEDADYPVENVLTLDPGEVAKAAAGTATLRLTFGGAQALVGFAIINTNLGGETATLSNDGGMTPQVVTVPDTEDGLAQAIWWDLREVSSASAAQWNVAITGASANVAIGTVLAITAWLEPKLKWDYEIRARQPAISHRTSLQTRKVYDVGVRYRFFEAISHWAEDRNTLRTLRRDCKGSVTPFLLVPDLEDDDAFLVQFVESDWRERYTWVSGRFDDDTAEGIVEKNIEVEEVNSGVAL